LQDRVQLLQREQVYERRRHRKTLLEMLLQLQLEELNPPARCFRRIYHTGTLPHCNTEAIVPEAFMPRWVNKKTTVGKPSSS
jgi:hypothetical protein